MHHFFAYIARMRYVIRWNLMRNSYRENIAEHSLQTAMVAHALAILHNKAGGHVDEKNVLALAVYHECGEVITGDLPTPIKYYNPAIRDAYKAADRICAYLKCLEELRAGTEEFSRAADSIKRLIDEIDSDAVRRFMRDFVPSFSLTLDELN